MTAHHDLAASLSARVLERIETDRCLNSANVAEAIFDGLVLRAAKGEPQAPASPDQAVMDAAKALCTTAVADPAAYIRTPANLQNGIDQLYDALKATGWRP